MSSAPSSVPASPSPSASSASPPPASPTKARGGALRHRDFRIYWGGQAVSLVGTWMQQTAQATVVVNLTGSLAALGTISFVASLPMMFLSMPGGVLADRLSRRKILIVTNFLLGLIALAYAWIFHAGRLTLPWIYVLSIIAGAVVAFDFPSQSALTPELVPPEDIPSAIALNQSIFHGARLVGPGLAGLLFRFASTTMVFVANAVSFLAVIWSLVVIKSPTRAARPKRAKGGKGAVGELFAYLKANPPVRAMLSVFGLTTTLIFPLLIVFMANFVKYQLHGTPGEFGGVMAASGLGALIGAMSIMWVSAEKRGSRIILTFALISLSALAQSFTHHVWQAALIAAVLSFGNANAMGLAATAMQVMVPDAMRGRLMALQGMMFVALMPTSALALGFIGDRVGLREIMRILAITHGVIGVPWLLSNGLWSLAPAIAPDTRPAAGGAP